MTTPTGGLHVPLPDSPTQDPLPGSPGPPHDPPPPSPPPAGIPVKAPGSPMIHWYVAPGTPPWMPQVSMTQGQPPPPSPPPAAPILAQPWMPPLWWPPVYPGPLPVAGGTLSSGGFQSSGGMMPLTMTPTSTQPPIPLPPEQSSSPASPAVQTLDRDDDEDIAEDQPMPAQPLLPARRPRAPSVADPLTDAEAQAEVVPVATPVEALAQVVPVTPTVDAPSEGAVAPAAKKARQYTLEPRQPWQPLPHLQPPLQPPAQSTSSSSPAALTEPTTTSSPTEPETKEQKQQDNDEDLAMDFTTPVQPADPPVLPLADQQAPAELNLEASRSRNRTHSEASETPTVACPELSHDPPHQIGQEDSSVPE